MLSMVVEKAEAALKNGTDAVQRRAVEEATKWLAMGIKETAECCSAFYRRYKKPLSDKSWKLTFVPSDTATEDVRKSITVLCGWRDPDSAIRITKALPAQSERENKLWTMLKTLPTPKVTT